MAMKMTNSLKKNSFFNILYNAANVVFPLITSMYVSRIILAEGVGKVAYGQNIASYFVLFATLGLPTYGVREIAKVRDDIAAKNRIFTELFLLNAIFTTIASVLYFALIWLIPKFDRESLLYICCGIQIVLNYANIDWLYQGEEEYVYISIRSIIVKILSFLFVFILVKDKQDYIWYAFISSLAVTANYLFNVIHAKKFVKLDFSELEFKKHLIPLLILAASVFLSAGYSKIDITMLGSMSTDSATGLYNNAHKIIDIIIVVCSSISSVFLPRLSYHYKHNKDLFYSLIEKGIKIISFISFPIAIGIFLLAPQVMLLLFGETFVPAATTIRIFSILIIVKSFGNLLCYQLVIATENEKKRLPAYAMAALINIILNAILIPRMAQNGAAVASVVSELIVNGVQLYAMCRIIDMPFPKKSLFQGIITSLIMGLLVLILSLIRIHYVIQIPICIICGCVVYLLLNYVVKNEMLILMIGYLTKKHRLHSGVK